MNPFLIIALLALSPTALDTVAGDTITPDSPLYTLETMGEQHKVALGFVTHADLAVERAEEYQKMAMENKEYQYRWLLDESNNQMEMEQNVTRAQERLQVRNQVLEQTRQLVPEEAKEGIDIAIEAPFKGGE